jgi:hypothetical protein
MKAGTIIMMMIFLGGVWGSFIYLVMLAVRKEREKRLIFKEEEK